MAESLELCAFASFDVLISSPHVQETRADCCAEQEEQQNGKALDVGAAVNSMLLQIAKDKLAANVRDLAAAAMRLAAAQQAAVASAVTQQADGGT